ncbi:hypothetical protein NE670_16265 [Flavonifractor plautii]|jgi:hypothetical protein|uniref:hypothetical protein n=1 Tax=Flavonifractor plautii TaxID=292800 RepID=UPI00210E64D3|nr:hypothetical protein [Flavonifractor plautii]MCQ4786810.1 hypothetical protein [Flavonifractor plautii]
MDIEKLIERLRTDSLYKDKATLEIMDLCIEAADALSTLQAENEKLWTGLKSNVDLVFRQAKELDRRHLLLQEQEAELEQVKRERDAAVSDLTFVVNQYRLETTGIDLCGLCEYDLPPVGENGQTAECPGFYVNDCFKWRGPEEG